MSDTDELRLLKLLSWSHASKEHVLPVHTYGPLLGRPSDANRLSRESNWKIYICYSKSTCRCSCGARCVLMYVGRSLAANVEDGVVLLCLSCADDLQDLLRTVLARHPQCEFVHDLVRLTSRTLVLRMTLTGQELASHIDPHVCAWCMKSRDSHDHCLADQHRRLQIITMTSHKISLLRCLIVKDLIPLIASHLRDLVWPDCVC